MTCSELMKRHTSQILSVVLPRIVQVVMLVTALVTSITSLTHAEKIRTAIPQANLNYLSVYVADGKGFFREEGLDNETVVISGPLSIAALLSGDVDFSGAGGSGMRAALQGAPDPGGLVFAQKEGLHSLGFLGDLFPMPFQGFVTTEKKLRENPGQIKRWLKAAIRGLMFVRERPEESVDLGIKKLQLGNATRAMIVEGTKNYLRAVSQGVPGLPSAEGIKNFLEYDIKIPMQLKEDVPPERLLSLQLVEEVKKELETAQRRPSR